MKFGTWRSKWQAVGRNLRRFWPAVVGMTLILSLVILNQDLSQPNKLREYSGEFGSPFLLLYGYLTAFLLMGDNFKSRYAYAIQSFPQTRENRFLGMVLSGLVMVLLPLLPVFVLVMSKTGFELLNPLVWLLQSILTWFLGFGLGMLGAVLTGTVFGALITGASLLLGLPLLDMQIDTLVETLLPGVVYRASDDLSQSTIEFIRSLAEDTELPPIPWGTMVILLVMGLLGLVVALILYRKRATEQAGNFLAFSRLKPIAKFLWACMGGMLLGELLYEVLGFADKAPNSLMALAWLLPGVVVSRLVVELVVEKTTRIFGKKQLLRYGLWTLATVCFILCIHLDPLGIKTRLPEREDVMSVEVSGNIYSAIFTDPADIDAILEFQESLFPYIEPEDDAAALYQELDISFVYNLKSGRQFRREYALWLPVSMGEHLDEALNHPLWVLWYSTMGSPRWKLGAVRYKLAEYYPEIVLDSDTPESMAETCMDFMDEVRIKTQNNKLTIETALEPEVASTLITTALTDLAEGTAWIYYPRQIELSSDYISIYLYSDVSLDEMDTEYMHIEIRVPPTGSATAQIVEELAGQYAWEEVGAATGSAYLGGG